MVGYISWWNYLKYLIGGSKSVCGGDGPTRGFAYTPVT